MSHSDSLKLLDRLQRKLDDRVEAKSIRTINIDSRKDGESPTIDFSSNDYLGIAHSNKVHKSVQDIYTNYTSKIPPPYTGSTGSRLLSGNSQLAVELEKFLASVHNRPSALICNSGYDANLSLLSSIPLPQDVIILDELCHNSLIMGVKMSRIPLGQVHYFRHNDENHLREILKKYGPNMSEDQNLIVVVESVYSMDGDIAPLQEILDTAKEFDASVIVDEAHGLGIYGKKNSHQLKLINDISVKETKIVLNRKKEHGGTGVLAALNLENHPALLAAVFTYGKAAGCHGAVICGTRTLIDYLINYSRPFIYSTSLPLHSLWTIKVSYDVMTSSYGDELREKVFELVKLFRSQMMAAFKKEDDTGEVLLPSPTPIQAVLCPGNEYCILIANKLKQAGIKAFPIRSPTVPKGQERIRIIIHSHNTKEEVLFLVNCLLQFLGKGKNSLMNNKIESKL